MGKKPKLKEKEFRITFKVTAGKYDPKENPTDHIEEAATTCIPGINEVLNAYDWLAGGSGYQKNFSVDEVDVEA